MTFGTVEPLLTYVIIKLADSDAEEARDSQQGE